MRNIAIVFLSFFCLEPFYCHSQALNMHFNGKDYKLQSDSSKIYIDNLLYYQLKAKAKPVLYKFCGKGFLTRETVSSGYDPFIEDLVFYNYFDSCIYREIVDSFKVDQLKCNTAFTLSFGNKDYQFFL